MKTLTTLTLTLTLTSSLLAAGCGGSTSSEPVIGQNPTAGGEPAPAGASPPVPSEQAGAMPASIPGSMCVGKAQLVGDIDWKILSGGVERMVHVHVPKRYDPTKATPVVLNFHGYTSNAGEEAVLSGMNDKSESAGFIAVHPEGLGTKQSWNAGACCGEAASAAVDDMGFVGKMIDELEAKLCVDDHRVFATGMSNGAFLSHRLACEMSSRIAAVAPVAGLLGVPACTPARAMSVFQFHGKLDSLVPYDGNPSLGFPSVGQTMAGWAARSGCSTTPKQTSTKGEVTCVTYGGCKDGAEVNLCTVAAGGHTWPGGLPVPALGHTTMDIHATDVMWDFFQKHPLP